MPTISEVINNPTLSALVGVVVGAILGFLVQYVLDKIRQGEKIQSVLCALCEELKEIDRLLNSQELKDAWERFERNRKIWDFFNESDEGRDSLTPERRPILPYYFPVSADFSIFYRSNANHIGQIQNSYLRSKLVENYSSLQTLVESYRRNNMLFSQFEEAVNRNERRPIDSFDFRLRQIAPKLKKDHDAVNQSTRNLIEMIKEELSRTSKSKF